MPAVPRPVPLGDSPTLRQIAEHHKVVKEAIELYYSRYNPSFSELFGSELSTSDPDEEIRVIYEDRLQEVNATFTMSLFGAIDASFRIDYDQRIGSEQPMDNNDDHPFCALRDALLDLERRKSKKDGGFVYLGSIRQVWETHYSDVPSDPDLWDDVHKAFKYRNWLVHGRYGPFEPEKRPQEDMKKYDFDTIYDLGCRIEAAFSSLRP